MASPTSEERRLGRAGPIRLGPWQPDPDRPGWVFVPATHRHKSVHRSVVDPDHVRHWLRADMRGAALMAAFIGGVLLFVMAKEGWEPGTVMSLSTVGAFFIAAGLLGSWTMRRRYLEAVRIHGRQHPPDPPVRASQ